MSGSPPPVNAPSLPEQASAALSASFNISPPVATLCGFGLPSFAFALGLILPSLQFPPPLPTFSISLGLNCSLDNPLNVSAGLSYGGGRVGQSDPDPDSQLLNGATS